MTCSKIAAFWNALRRRVTDFNPDYFLTGKIILFGITEPKSQATSAFNFLILLGKQFILRCKYQESVPSLKQFNNYILFYKSTEEAIAKKKNKFEKHKKNYGKVAQHQQVFPCCIMICYILCAKRFRGKIYLFLLHFCFIHVVVYLMYYVILCFIMCYAPAVQPGRLRTGGGERGYKSFLLLGLSLSI